MKKFAVIALTSLSLCAALAYAQAASVQNGALPRGGTFVIQPNATVSTTAVELWFRAPSAGYDNATPGLAQLAAAACAAAKLEGGRSLAEFVHSVGGELSIDVYPDMVSVSAVVPAAMARRAIATMTAAYFAPHITDTSLKIAQADAEVLIVERKYDSDRILQDALFAQLFPSGPAHIAPLPNTGAQLMGPALDIVTAFANKAFRSSNAVLALAGNVDISSVDAVTDGSGAGASDAPFDSPLAPSLQDGAIAGPVDGIGLAWAGPPISDEKAATALDFVNDYLFNEDTGVVQKEIAKMNAASSAGSSVVSPSPMQVQVAPSSPNPAQTPVPGSSPPPSGSRKIYLQLTLRPVVPTPAPPTEVAGQFITLHNPGVMIVTVSGGVEGSAAARELILRELAALTHPLDAQTFANAVRAFQYHILSDTQTPQTQADNLGWYSVEGNQGYAPGDPDSSYLRDVGSLDPGFVADVVRRYVGRPVLVYMRADSGDSGQ